MTNAETNPIAQYLDGLKWDGVPRIGRGDRPDINVRSWLATYLGCDDSPHTRSVGRMFLISMVASALAHGCQVQQTLLIVGSQGLGKSRALRALAHPWFSEWFSGGLTLEMLAGVWLTEVEMGSEVATMSKRVSAARRTQAIRQQNVFCGTTNDKSYLKDTSGSRRYWTVEAKSIDVESLAKDRDQLFAEAVVAYRALERWWPVDQIDPPAPPVAPHGGAAAACHEPQMNRDTPS